MAKNVGKIDRIIRFLVGAVLLYFALFSNHPLMQTPLYQYIAIGVGVVMLFVATMRICPLYSIFGISTCPAKQK